MKDRPDNDNLVAAAGDSGNPDTLAGASDRPGESPARVASAFWFVDPGGIVRLAEGDLIPLVGLNPHNVVGMGVREVFASIPDVDRLLAERRKGDTSVKRLTFGGREVENRSYPVLDDHGKLNGYYVVSVDLGSHLDLEDELSRSEAGRRAIIDAMPDTIFYLAADGTCLGVNPGCEIEMKETPERLIGSKPADLLPPDVARTYERLLAEVMETGQAGLAEYELVWGAHKRVEEVRMVVAGPNEVIAVVRDITERKRFEAQLLAQVEQRDLISRISTRLINLDLDEMEQGMLDSLGETARFLGFERAYLCSPEEHSDSNCFNLQWRAQGVDARKAGKAGRSGAEVREFLTELAAGKPYVLPANDDRGEQAGDGYGGFFTGILSAIYVRIEPHHGPGGFLGFESLTETVDCGDNAVTLLRIIGELIAGTLARKVAVGNIRAGEARFRALMEQAADGIFLSDRNGNLQEVNRRFCEMSGYTAERLCKMNTTDLVIAGDERNSMLGLSDLFAGSTVVFERGLRQVNGATLAVEISSRLLPDGRIHSIVRDISGRKRAEQDLRESEQRFRELSEASFEAIVVHDGGVILDVNTPFLNIFDCEREQAIGASTGDFTAPEERATVRDKRLGGFEGTYETVCLRPNGTTFPVEVRVKNTVYLGKEARLAVIRDINERVRREEEIRSLNETLEQRVAKRTAELEELNALLRWEINERAKVEQAIRETEEKYRLVTNNVRDVIWKYDIKKQRFTFVSQAAFELLGYTQSEALDTPMEKVIAPEYLPELSALVRKILRNPGDDSSVVVEAQHIHKDGTRIWCEVHESLEWGDEGDTPVLHGVTRDISERKRAERLARESEERFKKLIEHGSDIITVVNRKGNLVYVSPSAEQITGYKPGDVLNTNIFELIHTEDFEGAAVGLQRLVDNTQETYRLELRIRHQDGSWRYLENIAANLLDDPVINGVVVNSRDVTERIEAKRALQKAYDELETRVQQRTAEIAGLYAELQETDKLKNAFLSNVSHELRTPLVSIQGYVNLILEKEIDAERTREWLKIVLDAGKRLERLVSDLLDVSRLHSRTFAYDFEELELADLVDRCLATLKPILDEKGKTIRASYQDHLPPVWADASKTQSLIMNLLDNAIKFSPENPEIRIEIGRLSDDDVIVSVADQGIGIEEEELPKIFQPFYQVLSSTTRPYGGSGVGLALVKEIIEGHEGRLRVESTPGEGSIFRFTLPVAPAGRNVGKAA